MPTWKLFRTKRLATSGECALAPIDSLSAPLPHSAHSGAGPDPSRGRRDHHPAKRMSAREVTPASMAAPQSASHSSAAHNLHPTDSMTAADPAHSSHGSGLAHDQSAGRSTSTITLTVGSPSSVTASHPLPLLYSGRRRTAALNPRRSVRSLHSQRSTRSVRSGRSGVSSRSRSSRYASLDVPRRCYVCNNEFTGALCECCDTLYTHDCGPQIEQVPGIDFDLLCDLANANDLELLEAVVASAFSDVSTVVSTFYRPPDQTTTLSSGSAIAGALQSSAKPLSATPRLLIDRDAVTTMYTILGSVSSTCPMRAVLQGAQQALHARPHAQLSEQEIAYILVLLECPVFNDCSMFTKLTGPLQKLGRYASFRSRARVLLERCMGWLANSSADHHRYLIAHFAAFESEQFAACVNLLNAYVGHRLMFIYQQKNGGIPNKIQRGDTLQIEWYNTDWRIMAVVKMLAVYFVANTAANIIPISGFYNAVLDNIDWRTDFDRWQVTSYAREVVKDNVFVTNIDVFQPMQSSIPELDRRFFFCQFPFLLSIGAKNSIYEHTIRRELHAVLRQEFFASLANPAVRENHFTLQIRRTHLVDDTLVQLEAACSQLKKNLRVEFIGEPGIDAGGPRKEWLLLLFRDLCDPAREIFIADEQTNYCWFGNADLRYYTVAGIALGLALRNSIVVDVNLPLLLFKRLLNQQCTLEDLFQIWPTLAHSLQAILDYDSDDDFEDTFGLYFVSPDGTPLCPNGEHLPVTFETREKYVELVVVNMLQGKELDAFKTGFLEVAGGPGLKLFRPEEVDQLLRGDRKPLDIPALRSVTRYKHWGSHSSRNADSEPVVKWFWDFFNSLDPEKQAMLLVFITATDRVPATGIRNMPFRIICLGTDSERLPIAHTCFNQLGIYRYATRAKFESKMTLAMTEGYGFGLK